MARSERARVTFKVEEKEGKEEERGEGKEEERGEGKGIAQRHRPSPTPTPSLTPKELRSARSARSAR